MQHTNRNSAQISISMPSTSSSSMIPQNGGNKKVRSEKTAAPVRTIMSPHECNQDQQQQLQQDMAGTTILSTLPIIGSQIIGDTDCRMFAATPSNLVITTNNNNITNNKNNDGNMNNFMKSHFVIAGATNTNETTGGLGQCDSSAIHMNLKTSVSIATTAGAGGSSTSKYVFLSQPQRINGQMVTLESYPGTIINGTGSNRNVGSGIILVPSNTSSTTSTNASIPLPSSVVGTTMETLKRTTNLNVNAANVTKSVIGSHNLIEAGGDEELRPLSWLNNSNLIKDIVITNNNKISNNRQPNTNNNNNNNTINNNKPNTSNNNSSSNNCLKRRTTINGYSTNNNNICILNSMNNSQDLVEQQLPLNVRTVKNEKSSCGTESSGGLSGSVIPCNNSTANNKSKPLVMTNSGRFVDLPPETEIMAVKLNNNQQQQNHNLRTYKPILSHTQNQPQLQQLNLIRGNDVVQRKDHQQQLLLLDSNPGIPIVEDNDSKTTSEGIKTTLHVGPSGSTTVIEYNTGSGFVPTRQLFATGFRGVLNKDSLAMTTTALTATSTAASITTLTKVLTTEKSTPKPTSVLNMINSKTLTLVPSGITSVNLKSGSRTFDINSNNNSVNSINNTITAKKILSNNNNIPAILFSSSSVTNHNLKNGTKCINTAATICGSGDKIFNGINNINNNNSNIHTHSIITHHPHKKYLREKMNAGIFELTGGTLTANISPINNNSNSNNTVIASPSTITVSNGRLNKTIRSITTTSAAIACPSVPVSISNGNTSIIEGCETSKEITTTTINLPFTSVSTTTTTIGASLSSISSPLVVTATTTPTIAFSRNPPVATTHIPAGYTLVKHPVMVHNASPLLSPITSQTWSTIHPQVQSPKSVTAITYTTSVVNSTLTTTNSDTVSASSNCVNVTAAAASSLLSLAQINPTASDITSLSKQRSQQFLITQTNTSPTVTEEQQPPSNSAAVNANKPSSPISQSQTQLQTQRSLMVCNSPMSYSSYDNDSLKDLDLNGAISSPGFNGLTSLSQSQKKQSLSSLQSTPTSLTTPTNTPASTPTPSSTPTNTPPRNKNSSSNNNKTNLSYDPLVHTHNKPPYSFSSLIFMAIEKSEEKALPVKEIYAWIEQHFPYFKTAPTGWKNSVRHNLSLNKSFIKVEKSQNMGKGSLWRVEPQQRPNLIQALNRSPYYQQTLGLEASVDAMLDTIPGQQDEQNMQHHLDELLDDSAIPNSCSNSIDDIPSIGSVTASVHNTNNNISSNISAFDRNTSSRSSCSSISSHLSSGNLVIGVTEVSTVNNLPLTATATTTTTVATITAAENTTTAISATSVTNNNLNGNNCSISSRFDPTLFPNLSKVFGGEGKTATAILTDIKKDVSQKHKQSPVKHYAQQQKSQESSLMHESKFNELNYNSNGVFENNTDIPPTKKMKTNSISDCQEEIKQQKEKQHQQQDGVNLLLDRETTCLSNNCQSGNGSFETITLPMKEVKDDSDSIELNGGNSGEGSRVDKVYPINCQFQDNAKQEETTKEKFSMIVAKTVETESNFFEIESNNTLLNGNEKSLPDKTDSEKNEIVNDNSSETNVHTDEQAENTGWINGVFGGRDNYTLESLARDYGVENIEDARAAVVMLAFKYGRKIFDQVQSASNPTNSSPVITSSPSEDHTYSTGGIGDAFTLTLPLLPSVSNDSSTKNDVSMFTSAASTVLTTAGLVNDQDDNQVYFNLQNELLQTNYVTVISKEIEESRIKDGVDALLALSTNLNISQIQYNKQNWRSLYSCTKKCGTIPLNNDIISKESFREARKLDIEHEVKPSFSLTRRKIDFIGQVSNNNSNNNNNNVAKDPDKKTVLTDLRCKLIYEKYENNVTQSVNIFKSTLNFNRRQILHRQSSAENRPVKVICKKRVRVTSNRTPLRCLRTKLKRKASWFR